MAEFTKEQLIERAKEALEVFNNCLLVEGEELPMMRKSAALYEIALASLEAEAVGEVVLGEYDDCGCHPDARVVCIAADGQADWENFRNGTKLYAAPQLPQPAVVSNASRENFEAWARGAGFNENWYFFTNTHPNHYDDDHINDMWATWNACRAAMLKGKK